jgi:DNA-binding transcriptional MerR regulator
MQPELTIQQVSEKTGLSCHTIRYYERIGLINDVDRADNGHRRYSDDNIGWIDFLKCLKGTGMPITEIQRFVDLSRQGDYTISSRVEILKTQKDDILNQIDDLHEYLARIEGKIGYYESLEVQQVIK